MLNVCTTVTLCCNFCTAEWKTARLNPRQLWNVLHSKGWLRKRDRHVCSDCVAKGVRP